MQNISQVLNLFTLSKGCVKELIKQKHIHCHMPIFGESKRGYKLQSRQENQECLIFREICVVE